MKRIIALLPGDFDCLRSHLLDYKAMERVHFPVWMAKVLNACESSIVEPTVEPTAAPTSDLENIVCVRCGGHDTNESYKTPGTGYHCSDQVACVARKAMKENPPYFTVTGALWGDIKWRLRIIDGVARELTEGEAAVAAQILNERRKK